MIRKLNANDFGLEPDQQTKGKQMSYIPEWLAAKPEHEVSPEQVNTISKHIFKHQVAKGISERISDLPGRITAWHAIMDMHKEEPSHVQPGQERIPPKEDRPELKPLERFRSPERNGFQIARDKAQAMIDSAATVSMEQWREQARLGRIQPGPGISSPDQNPRTIRW